METLVMKKKCKKSKHEQRKTTQKENNCEMKHKKISKRILHCTKTRRERKKKKKTCRKKKR